MADFQKRTKKARKQAAKRAKKTRKAVARTSPRARAQAFASLFIAGGAATIIAKLVKGTDEQRYSDTPETLPNTPERPAATTTPPSTGAGTRETGSDTGTLPETERARLEQTS